MQGTSIAYQAKFVKGTSLLYNAKNALSFSSGKHIYWLQFASQVCKPTKHQEQTCSTKHGKNNNMLPKKTAKASSPFEVQAN